MQHNRIFSPELREQAQQVGLDLCVCSQLGEQPLEQGLHKQAHLRLAHVVLGLRLSECHLAQVLRVAPRDLLTEPFAQLIGEVWLCCKNEANPVHLGLF